MSAIAISTSKWHDRERIPSPSGRSHRKHYLGVSLGDTVLGSGLDSWMTMPLAGSPDVYRAWVI
jgi:hypothetical protein